MVGATLLLAGLLSVVLTHTAGADSGVTLTAPSPNSPSGQTVTSGTPFSSGQTVTVQVSAAAEAAAGMTNAAGLQIRECAAPGGVDPVSPAAVGACDGNTYQSGSPTVNLTSGTTYTGYTVYALPDFTILQENSPGAPTCDLTDECVLYIGQNPNLASAPHIYSNAFYVDPGDGSDSGASPGDGSAPTVGGVDKTKSTVVASKSTVVADAGDASTITVTLLDSTGNAVADKGVTLMASGGSSTITPEATGGAAAGTTDSSGVATFSVTDTAADSVTYTAEDTSDTITLDASAPVTFVTPIVTAGSTAVTASPSALPADGTSSSTVTVILRDQAGVVVPGKTVSLGVGTHAAVTPSSMVTDKAGTATFSVTDATAEKVTATPTDVTDSNLAAAHYHHRFPVDCSRHGGPEPLNCRRAVQSHAG